MIEGGYAYGYLFMSQNRFAEPVFTELLSIVKPSRILEIGTFHGGLTLMLRDLLDKLNLHNHWIRTYDINEQEFLKPLIGDRLIDVRTENLFNDTYSGFRSEDKAKELTDYIQQSGQTLVLCDGGCKRCEFNIISPLLKINDIIMAHDYAPNPNYFETKIQNKIWNWMEIQDSDIKEISSQFNLSPFCQELAQRAAWCCKIKSL